MPKETLKERQLNLLYRMQDREWHKINVAKKELAKINMRIQSVASGKSAIETKKKGGQMPREIDCPDCEGKGEIITADRSTYPPSEDFMKCFNPNCNNGKITVYTGEELQKAIKAEREECALICEELLLYAGVKGETKALKEAAKQIRAK